MTLASGFVSIHVLHKKRSELFLAVGQQRLIPIVIAGRVRSNFCPAPSRLPDACHIFIHAHTLPMSAQFETEPLCSPSGSRSFCVAACELCSHLSHAQVNHSQHLSTVAECVPAYAIPCHMPVTSISCMCYTDKFINFLLIFCCHCSPCKAPSASSCLLLLLSAISHACLLTHCMIMVQHRNATRKQACMPACLQCPISFFLPSASACCN